MRVLNMCLVVSAILCASSTTLQAEEPAVNAASESSEATFGQDVEFLSQHVKTIVLRDSESHAAIAVVPAYQGRVMTSSAAGDEGLSFGWINHEHVASGKLAPHINVYGGEERFWLGPEGGQFSIFFSAGAKFELADWQTPAPIDSEPFDVVAQSDLKIDFRKQTKLTNYSGTQFDVQIDRTVELADTLKLLADPGNAHIVGYRTINRLTNTGNEAWTREKGLLSIWLLGMYKPGPQTTVVIPCRVTTSDRTTDNLAINDAYFGKVPADKLKIIGKTVFFSGDGTHRSKIGIPPAHARNICGSYDASRGVLTLVLFNQPDGSVTDYVNSMWELQDKPYAGDVINAYNDGPPAPGAKPLGPFYELETSSPALALKPGESITHTQETYHLQGDKQALDHVAQEILGVSIAEIEAGLE